MHQAFLWEIKQGGQAPPSFVLGSMHSTDQRVFGGLDQLTALLNEVDYFALEFDSQTLNEEQQLQLHLAQQLPQGQQLSDLVSPSIWSKLQKLFAQELGMPFLLDQLTHSRPMLIPQFYNQWKAAKDYPVALDHYLLQLAQEKELQIENLETFEEMLSVFENLPLAPQIWALKKFACQGGKQWKKFQQSLNAYAEGNLPYLLKQQQKVSGKSRRVILLQRNQAILPRMQKLMDKGPSLMVLGLYHLIGAQGLLRSLKQKGYLVRPLF